MKRFLFLLAAMQIAFIPFAQNNKPVITMTVLSTDPAVMDEMEQAEAISQIEVLFQKELKGEYTIRLVDPDSEDAFALIRNTELRQNKISRDFDPDTRKRSRLKGASNLCVVEIKKNKSGEYILTAKIGDTETSGLKESALYPEKGDTPLISLDRESLQRACLFLISRLGLGKKTAQELSVAENNAKNKANAKALAWSIIPGVGLIQKGHNEGYAYLGGEIALCLGGVMVPELMRKSYINKRNHESNAHNRDVYTSRANTCRKVSVTCGAVAGVAYVVNLVHSYLATPKKDAKIQWGFTVLANEYSNDYSMGLSLSCNF